MFVLETCVVLFSGLSHCRAEPRGGHVLWGRVPWRFGRSCLTNLQQLSGALCFLLSFHVFITLKGQSSRLPSFSLPSPDTKILLNILTHTIWGGLVIGLFVKVGILHIAKCWKEIFKVKTILSVGLKSNVASRNQLFSFWGSFIISCLYLGLVITWK